MATNIYEYFRSLVTDHQINIGDVGAGGITLATILQALPTATTLLSFVWVALRLVVFIRDEFINKKRDKNGDE